MPKKDEKMCKHFFCLILITYFNSVEKGRNEFKRYFPSVEAPTIDELKKNSEDLYNYIKNINDNSEKESSKKVEKMQNALILAFRKYILEKKGGKTLEEMESMTAGWGIYFRNGRQYFD